MVTCCSRKTDIPHHPLPPPTVISAFDKGTNSFTCTANGLETASHATTTFQPKFVGSSTCSEGKAMLGLDASSGAAVCSSKTYQPAFTVDTCDANELLAAFDAAQNKFTCSPKAYLDTDTAASTYQPVFTVESCAANELLSSFDASAKAFKCSTATYVTTTAAASLYVNKSAALSQFHPKIEGTCTDGGECVW